MKWLRGGLLDRHLPQRAVGTLALGLSLALAATGAQALPIEAAVSGRALQQDPDPAESEDAKAAGRPADAAKKAAVTVLEKAAWPEPGSVEVPVDAAGKAVGKARAGGLGITVGAPEAAKRAEKGKRARDTDPGAVAKAKVTALDHRAARELGAAALLRVERTDGKAEAGKVRLTVDYAEFAEAYGGDYAARLRLVQLPGCAAVAPPGSADCPAQPVELPTRNSVDKRTISADVTAHPAQEGLSTQTTRATGLLAVTAGASSSQGDYKATPLSPSASWSVSNSSGGFSWNYPIRTAPAPGGLAPSVGLGYSSQSVDGRTSVTNNQGSWLGEGFSYEAGYIERAYKPCADDGHSTSAEQCWAFDNATILLDGTSSQLIKDDDGGEWHFTNESGAKVEKITSSGNGDDNGEAWKVTTTDGTEYYFGLHRLPGWASGDETTNSVWTAPVFGDDSGEPCYQATFTSAHCQQAWRWNLDYVKDTHGNVMSYYYGAEVNHYALNAKTDVNGTPYERGGYLKRIDYGQRDGQVYAAKAPARVVFDVSERCLPTTDFDCATAKRTTANAAHWPDTPVDLECKAATRCTSSQVVPSFFTTKRLTAITTQVRKDTTSYQDVDAWSLTHIFTDNGDQSKTLWLSKIGHEGRVGGSIKLPSLDLQGIQLPNRVDKDGDNIDAFHRFRLVTVVSETGAQLDVTYAPADCSATALPEPGTSVKRCYPVKWAPPGYTEPVTDWFHKYVVAETLETDRTGGGADLVTRYDYQGPAAWRHVPADGLTPEKYRTWSQWQGYGKVSVTAGDGETMPSRVDYTYLQGMHGDKDPAGGTRSVTVTDSTGVEYTDHPEFTGFEIESAAYSAGKIVAKSVTEPSKRDTATQTRSWGTVKATLVQTKTNRDYKARKDGTWQSTKTVTSYDTATDAGRLTQVEELGDTERTGDEQCTRIWYADNAAKNILSLPRRSEAVSVACSLTPDRSTQVLADERVSYDGGAYGAAPVRGDATRTERLTKHDGTTATYQVTGTTEYDAFGRPTSQTDAGNATTTTRYTDVNGLISRTEVTNALGHVTTTDYAPAWGVSTGQSDPNGKRTELAYDALGRLVSVWLADRAKTQTPSIKYSYDVRKDKVTAVKMEKIQIDGTYGAEYQLYDSLLRSRQIQTQGPDGSRMMADTFYDGVGKIKKVNQTYNALGAPEGELQIVTNGEVGAQTLWQYDGMGRPTAEIFAVAGVEQWRTTTVYEGDRTHTDPPVGGVPTTAITDIAGRTVELRHYEGGSPNPQAAEGPGNGYDATKYSYTPGGQLKTVTDAEGNVWSYEYDQLGRQTKSTDPDAGTTITAYDALDHQVSITDARGIKTSTQYDKLGRPTFTWEGEPGTGTKLTETRYDRAGWLGQAWASLRFVDGGPSYFASVTQEMDEFYRPLKAAYSVPASEGALAGTYVFTSAYSRDGTLRSMGMPAVGTLGAETLELGYDELQRPSSMSSNLGSYVTGAVFSTTSQLKQLQLSTGSGAQVNQTFQYEKGTDRLRSSATDIIGKGAVRDAHYSYDQAGNVTAISDLAGGVPDVQCFAYDTRQRLSQAWTPAATAATAAGSGTVGSQLSGSRRRPVRAHPAASRSAARRRTGSPTPPTPSATAPRRSSTTPRLTRPRTSSATTPTARTRPARTPSPRWWRTPRPATAATATATTSPATPPRVPPAATPRR
ncbi:sugar-binding protein [Streptomyces sp. NPDC006997]|uniref:sugar-binding protein n=1 Tax=Streptomyces sp. NPDC006997 TaxID=3155356 RepID=UPI0033CFD70D